VNQLLPTKNKGNAGRGRPRRSLNKTTVAAKNVIAEVAEEVGGVKRMVAWVLKDEKNETIFWTQIYPKLLPLQTKADDEDRHFPITRIETVIVSPKD
jgi:hypothetical protein